MSELERLDDDLAALFAKERSEHVSEPMVRDEMLERVERAIRMAALAPPAAAAASGAALATKVAVGVAIVVAFGGGVVVGRETAPSREATPASTTPVSTLAATTSNAPAPPAIESSTPSTPVSDLPSAATASARPIASSSSNAPASDLAKEQALIDTARAALARGRGADALAAVEAHASRYPRGALAEEREALAVQALVVDGKPDAARARAAQFHRRYPSSIFGGAVDRALSGP